MPQKAVRMFLTHFPACCHCDFPAPLYFDCFMHCWNTILQITVIVMYVHSCCPFHTQRQKSGLPLVGYQLRFDTYSCLLLEYNILSGYWDGRPADNTSGKRYFPGLLSTGTEFRNMGIGKSDYPLLQNVLKMV